MKSLLPVLLLLLPTTHSAPTPASQTPKCTSIAQRKAWHTLTDAEKQNYISAEKCLMSTPARLGLSGARTVFDEFQKLHVLNTKAVHFVGSFLPFHRYLLATHSSLLTTLCNLTTPHPYWDESLDAGSFLTSPLLSPVTGFGGDGSGPNNCITDGPFKDYVNSLGPYEEVGDHCIDRKVDECVSKGAAREEVEKCMGEKDFEGVRGCLEGVVHGAGHGGVGGQMSNLFSSPGDPLFYLHHAWLDKLWAQWQDLDKPARLTDISGPNVGFLSGGNASFPPGFPAFPPPGGAFPPPGFPGNGTGNGNATCPSFPPFFPPPATQAQIRAAGSVPGDPGQETTLGHVLTTYGMVGNVTVGDVMDTVGGYLCYEYV